MSVFFILAVVFGAAAVPMLVLSATLRRSPWLAAGMVNLLLALVFAASALFAGA